MPTANEVEAVGADAGTGQKARSWADVVAGKPDSSLAPRKDDVTSTINENANLTFNREPNNKPNRGRANRGSRQHNVAPTTTRRSGSIREQSRPHL